MFQRIETCFDRFEWVNLNGLKRVSTGFNRSERVSTGLDRSERVPTGFNRSGRIVACFNGFHLTGTHQECL